MCCARVPAESVAALGCARKAPGDQPANRRRRVTRGRRAEREVECSKQPRATKGPCLVFDFSASFSAVAVANGQRTPSLAVSSLNPLRCVPSSTSSHHLPPALLLRRGQLASPPLAHYEHRYPPRITNVPSPVLPRDSSAVSFPHRYPATRHAPPARSTPTLLACLHRRH